MFHALKMHRKIYTLKYDFVLITNLKLIYPLSTKKLYWFKNHKSSTLKLYKILFIQILLFK